MFSQRKKDYNQSRIAEINSQKCYSGRRPSIGAFTEFIISEHRKDCENGKNVWTQKQQSNIIKLPTVKS